jgi:hypothetical protein
MPTSKPTRDRAFGMRIVTRHGEQWSWFSSSFAMSSDLASRLHTTTHGVNHEANLGLRVPFTRVSAIGTCIFCIRQTPYQAEHTHFGPTWRIHADWTSYEVFDRNGYPLQIQKILSTCDLEGQLKKGRDWKVSHGERGHGPIPHVRKSRGGFGWFRNIRTTQEIRLNTSVHAEEGEIPVRAARNKRNLPTAWEDIIRTPQRSWKAQRKARKQWDRQ